MNVSGKCFEHFFRILEMKNIEDCLIVHDDLESKFGKCKIKEGGSAGGHNGLKSIIEYMN